ncbi:hypothetical protein VPJ68_01070 [Parabacteroides distasonis]
MAFTRGGVDQDFKKLPYKNIVSTMFTIAPNKAYTEMKIKNYNYPKKNKRTNKRNNKEKINNITENIV